jgi:hypothetical protein
VSSIPKASDAFYSLRDPAEVPLLKLLNVLVQKKRENLLLISQAGNETHFVFV